MPVYEYRCRQCGAKTSETKSIADYDPNAKPICDECKEAMGQVFGTVPFRMPMPGHYNPTVGRYVKDERDFRDGLRAASEAATARTGIEHNYQPVDLRDHERLGVTGDGLGATMRRLHHEGRPLPKLPFDTD